MGITFSPWQELGRWRAELDLQLPLLSDADRAVALAYGAADSAQQEKAARVSVLIAHDARVIASYESFEPASHADRVIMDLDRLGN